MEFDKSHSDRIIFVFVLILALAGHLLFAALTPDLAAAQTLEEYRLRLAEVRRNISELQVQEQDLHLRLSELGAKVEAEKSKETALKRLLGNPQLSELLSQSKALVDQLNALIKERVAQELKEKEIMEQLIDKLSAEINTLERRCLRQKDKEACRKLSACQNELYELLVLRLKDKKLKLVVVKLQPEDGPDEIKLKLEVLEHQLCQINDLIALYRNNIKALKKQLRVFSGMQEFLKDLEDYEFAEEEMEVGISAIAEPTGNQAQEVIAAKIELAERDLRTLRVYRRQVQNRLSLFEKELQKWEEK